MSFDTSTAEVFENVYRILSNPLRKIIIAEKKPQNLLEGKPDELRETQTRNGGENQFRGRATGR